MDKLSVVVSCPIDTYSGYGARARDFVKALLELDKYEVKVLSQRWGNTRFGYLDAHGEDELSSIIIPKITSKPDIWIQVTVPNEFQAVGTYNIGVTAGIETTVCDASWIQGCNRMNLILTSSQHSKKVFETTIYDMQDPKTKQPTGKLKLDVPCEVLLEGADLTKYFETKVSKDSDVGQTLDQIKESFCYLFVGHWLQGKVGEDRKNIGYTIKSFLETFKNKKNAPALILKTQQATSSILDKNRIEDRIQEIKNTVRGSLPNIYLLHGDLTDEQMNEVYNHSKVKAMINLTKGEGFGRPLLEFSLTGKPIIASGWSGHTDFLRGDMTVLVGGELEKVGQSAVVQNVILPDAMWFKPDDGAVGRLYKDVVKNYKKYIPLSKKQKYYSKKNFAFENMVADLDKFLTQYVPNIPKQVELKLPELKLVKDE